MSWKKVLGFGVLLWIIMFVLVSAFLAFKFYPPKGPSWMAIVMAVVSGVIAYIFAGKLKPASLGQALGYGIFWVVVCVILDFLITKQFENTIFSQWTIWLSYLLVLLAPLLQVTKTAETRQPPPTAPVG